MADLDEAHVFRLTRLGRLVETPSLFDEAGVTRSSIQPQQAAERIVYVAILHRQWGGSTKDFASLEHRGLQVLHGAQCCGRSGSPNSIRFGILQPRYRVAPQLLKILA